MLLSRWVVHLFVNGRTPGLRGMAESLALALNMRAMVEAACDQCVRNGHIYWAVAVCCCHARCCQVLIIHHESTYLCPAHAFVKHAEYKQATWPSHNDLCFGHMVVWLSARWRLSVNEGNAIHIRWPGWGMMIHVHATLAWSDCAQKATEKAECCIVCSCASSVHFAFSIQWKVIGCIYSLVAAGCSGDNSDMWCNYNSFWRFSWEIAGVLCAVWVLHCNIVVNASKKYATQNYDRCCGTLRQWKNCSVWAYRIWFLCSLLSSGRHGKPTERKSDIVRSHDWVQLPEFSWTYVKWARYTRAGKSVCVYMVKSIWPRWDHYLKHIRHVRACTLHEHAMDGQTRRCASISIFPLTFAICVYSKWRMILGNWFK